MIEKTLEERGNRYGEFSDCARISQTLKSYVATELRNQGKVLTNTQREAMEMILHKIARIVNGDPNYDDSWRDISGYATLVVKDLGG